MVQETAAAAQSEQRVSPPLRRHAVAPTLLERGMPLEQLQQLLGQAQRETTQMDAASTPDMSKARSQKALAG